MVECVWFAKQLPAALVVTTLIEISLFLGINGSVSKCSRLLHSNFSLRTKQYGLYLSGYFLKCRPTKGRANECLAFLPFVKQDGRLGRRGGCGGLGGPPLFASHLPACLPAFLEGMNHTCSADWAERVSVYAMPKWRKGRAGKRPTMEFRNEWNFYLKFECAFYGLIGVKMPSRWLHGTGMYRQTPVQRGTVINTSLPLIYVKAMVLKEPMSH